MKSSCLLFCVLAFCGTNRLFAQTNEPFLSADSTHKYRLTNEVVWAAIGHHHSFDSYLSTQLYQGAQLSLGFEQQRFFSDKWTKLSKYDGASLKMASDYNMAGNHIMLTPQVRGFYGAHYHLPAWGRLKLMPGAYTNWDLGLKYLPHNGNNPVNVIANTNLWLSAMMVYRFNLRNYPVCITNHFSVATCGVMFSPKYTQLYYDIAAVEGLDGHGVLTNPANRKQFRNEFAADLPLGNIATFRLAFVAERLRYEVSELEGRNLECLFMVGIVRNFYTFRGKETIPNQFITIAE